MAEEYLSQGGLYLHEYSRGIRLLHPDHHCITYEVIRQCDQYLKDSYDFVDLGFSTLQRFESVQERLEKERLATVVKRSKLQMVETERNAALLSVKTLIQAKQERLDRLTKYYSSLRNLTTHDD